MRVINLLPKEKQLEFRYRKMYRSLLMLFSIVGASFALVVLFQFGSRLYMERQIKQVKLETEKLRAISNKEENNELKKRIQQINSQVTDFNKLSEEAPQWSGVVRAFAKLVPADVYVQIFSVDIAKRQVNITGFAPRRELVIALYNNIKGDTEHFANIDYPLENVSRPTDVQFRYSFTVQEGAIK
jgi:Tfp pilus assembly protein PilN